MAIYQRDRTFHQLFSEIEVDIIPMKFIRDITCHLDDGTKVILDTSDFPGDDVDSNHLENLIKHLDFYDNLTDLQIRINYDLVEENVNIAVSKMLDITNK